jgi:hypothetical protein
MQRQVHVRRQVGAERSDVLADNPLQLPVQRVVNDVSDDRVGDKCPYLPRVERRNTRWGPTSVRRESLAKKIDAGMASMIRSYTSDGSQFSTIRCGKGVSSSGAASKAALTCRAISFSSNDRSSLAMSKRFSPVDALDRQELLVLDAQRIDRSAQLARLVRNRIHSRERPEKRFRAKQIGSGCQAPEDLSAMSFLK